MTLSLGDIRQGPFPRGWVMIGRYAGAIAALGMMLSAQQSKAAVIIDDSPDALGGVEVDNWVNIADSQNFLVEITLTSGATIGGFDIYSVPGLPTLGQAVTIKIRDDAGGAPDSSNLYTIDSSVDAIDEVGTAIDNSMERVNASFAPITLAAGTYWIGMSGSDGAELGWSSVNVGPERPATPWQLAGDTLEANPAINALAFRVDGPSSAVPEPGTWT
jgi:hypothetical protein